MPNLGKAFEITYEVMAASLKDTYRDSVFCMNDEYGDPIACNFIHHRYDYDTSKYIPSMRISSRVGWTTNEKDYDGISANKWIKVKVYQRADGANYIYGIEIDDKTILSMTHHRNSYAITDVEVYGGDKYGEALDGKIRHLCIRSK